MTDGNDPVLHYIYDPLCGWCYAAAPLAEAAAAAGATLVLHGGGLWDTPQPYPSGMVASIRKMEAGIARTTGQPYGDAYTHGLLSDPLTILHSRPPIAAVLAAARLRAGADLAMLHAVQKAHFVQGRRVVEPSVLERLAPEVELDPSAFRQAMSEIDVNAHIAQSRRLMQRTGAQGFPTFLRETGGALSPIPHADLYGRPGDFAKQVMRPA